MSNQLKIFDVPGVDQVKLPAPQKRAAMNAKKYYSPAEYAQFCARHLRDEIKADFCSVNNAKAPGSEYIITITSAKTIDADCMNVCARNLGLSVRTISALAGKIVINLILTTDELKRKIQRNERSAEIEA